MTTEDGRTPRGARRRTLSLVAVILGAVLASATGAAATAAAPGSLSGTLSVPGGGGADGIDVIAFSATAYGTAVTDPSGGWTIAGLAPGAYRVAYRDASRRWPDGYWSATGFTDDIGSAGSVPVASGAAIAGIDSALVAGHRVSGQVLGDGGAPEPNAGVRWCRGPVCGFGASTDADGAFGFQVVSGGYTLAVQDAFGADLGFVSGVSLGDQASATTFDAATGDRAGISVQLPAGAAGPHIAGAVIGPDSAPVAAVGVQACQDGGVCQQTATRADGSWRLPVRAGTYRVGYFDTAARHPAGWWSRTGFVRSAAAATLVTVGTGGVTGIDINLPAGYQVSGRVTDPAGTGVGGIAVLACGPGGADCGQGTTADDGTWSIGPLAAGTYTVSFSDPAGRFAASVYRPAGWSDAIAAATPVTVADGDIAAIDTQLVRGAHVGGTILDGSGLPLAGVRVQLCGDGRACASVESDATGAWHAAVGPGAARLEVYGDTPEGWLDGWLGAGGYTRSRPAATLLSIGSADQSIATIVLSARPRLLFAAGSTLSSTGSLAMASLIVRWPSSDTTSSTRVDASQDGGPSARVATVDPSAAAVRSASVTLALGHTYRIRTRDFTTDRHDTPQYDAPIASLPVAIRALQESGSAFTFQGAWAVSTGAGASGGTLRSATARGATATITFRGRSVAWVGSRGPGFGTATVFVDGRQVATVDCSAPASTPRSVLWAGSWVASGAHELRIIVAGTTGHARIDVDAVLLAQ